MTWTCKIGCQSILTIIIVAILSSCSNVSNEHAPIKIVKSVPLNYELFDWIQNKSDVEQDIFYLSQKKKNELLATIEQKMLSGTPKHLALSEVMTSMLGQFTYYGETHYAEDVASLNKGNCMSLAVLTGAFAEVIGLDFSYKEVRTLPVYSKENNLLLSSTHVQTILYDESFTPQNNYVYFSKPSVVIDYFPVNSNKAGRSVSKASFISMFYKNLAANALIQNNLDRAFYLAEKSYGYDKRNVEVINLLGVIHRRAGDILSAENIYKIGMEVSSSSLALMSNYLMLLRSEQRFVEADRIESKLALLDDPNPYQWLEQAYSAQMQNNSNKAVLYYKKALDKAPYLHQAYIGLYQIYSKNGQHIQAKKMLVKALEWTYEIEERKQYKYKLYSLNTAD
jgi:Flp pilus assembly protein TadD